MRAFAAEVAACGQITSGDIVPLAKFARQQVRAAGLGPKEAAEEFFKLALEHGLDPDYAAMIRRQVMTIR